MPGKRLFGTAWLLIAWVAAFCSLSKSLHGQNVTVSYGTPVNLVADSGGGYPVYVTCGQNFGSNCQTGSAPPNGNINWTLDGATVASSYDTVDDNSYTCQIPDDNNNPQPTQCDFYYDESGYSGVLSVGTHTVTANIPSSQDPYAAFSTTWTVTVTAPPPPSITSISPSSAFVGTAVTITGSSFGATQATSSVTIGGVAAAVSSWSDTSIQATVPNGATSGAVYVTVNGTTSNTQPFSVTPPAPTSLSLACAPNPLPVGQTANCTASISPVVAGNASFTLVGNTTVVAFDGSGHAVLAGQFQGAPANTYTITVSYGGDGAHQASSASTSVQVVANGPQIDALSLPEGPVTMGIRITGQRFSASEGASTVQINGVDLNTSSWSDGEIIAQIPAGAATGSIVVTVQGQASNGKPFQVDPAFQCVLQ